MEPRALLLILQASDTGQLQALEELKGCAAAGGDVGDGICKAQLLASCCGVAAADDGDRLGVSQSLCYGDGTLCEGGVLKYAHRTVPDNGLGSLSGISEENAGLLADIQTHHISGDLIGVNDLNIDVSIDGIGEGLSNDSVDGEQELNALLLSLCQHVPS